MVANLLALVLTVATLTLLGWRWHAVRRQTSIDWWAVCLLPPALLTFWLVAAQAVIGTLDSDWNGARLAPTFALVHGYQLYYPASGGPILNTIYGPVAALAFLPAAIFRTPTPAILAGGVLEIGFIFGALILFVLRASGRGGRGPLAIACALGACLLLTRYPASRYWVTMVHADGPALGLGLLACAALVSPDGLPPDARRLAWSALAVVLACWTKQTVAPLPLALAVWLAVAYGRAVAGRYVLIVGVAGGIVSVAFLVWLGKPMLFNMIELVGRQAWYQPGVAGLLARVRGVAESVWEVPALVLLALAATLALCAAPERSVRRPWVAALLAAIVLLPAGALGANKLGGSESSFHSIYYLIAALATLLVDASRTRAGRLLAYVGCAAIIVATWRSGSAALLASHAPLRENRSELAYAFARAHPGEVYFPWHPLASLLAEGRLYHFEYGVMDRFLAGYQPSPEHLRADLPERLRWIAAPTPVWTFSQLPEFSEQVELAELPRWAVRVRRAP